MTDILCTWLNQELKLSKTLDPKNLDNDFSNGYLFGEILYKYQMQDDFSMFLKKNTSISKVNNFTRLRPTFKLLGIPLDIHTSEDLMQVKEGVATHLLHQLYDTLHDKKISRTLMQAGQEVRQNANLELLKISEHYKDKSRHLTSSCVVTQPIQQKTQLKVQNEKLPHLKHRDVTGNQVNVPEPSSYTAHLHLNRRQQQHKEREAQTGQTNISQFQEQREKLGSSTLASFSSDQLRPEDFLLGGTKQTVGDNPQNQLKFLPTSEYIQEIQQRMKEKELRGKRVERFLVEQSKALEAQQNAERDEQLLKRLTRPTKQVQRLVAHLTQIRKQKDVIVANRLFREQQIQQTREKDFQEALHREAVLAQQAKLAREEELRHELEFCNMIAAEHAERRHKKHFDSCKDILGQIVDLATKVGEYRLLTKNLIPKKLMKEWMEFFFRGLPLHEPKQEDQTEDELLSLLDPTELKKQEILNNLDYNEYSNMVGEWTWLKESGETKLPPNPNYILVHVVQRLMNIVHPTSVESPFPSFPHTSFRACVLGKFCSGKTTCLAKIGKALGIRVVSADALFEEALKPFKTVEEVIRQLGRKDNKQRLTSSTTPQSDVNNSRIPNEVLVDIIVGAISQLPSQSGWILDGFPHDATQAHLLEKALNGSVEENVSASSTTNLAADPDPPKPAPHLAPALDLALLLDIPDESVVRRAYSHCDTDPTNKALYLSQIPFRIPAFHEAWPELEKWFGEKQDILVRVNADVGEGELYSMVEFLLQQLIKKKHDALANPPVEDVSDSTEAPGTSSALPVQPPALTGHTESNSSLKEEKLQRQTGNVSFSSMSKDGTKNKSESVSSTSCSAHQPFVEEALPLEKAEYLCSFWDHVCESYVNDIKSVLEQLRSQLIVIEQDLFSHRERYKHYLGRPDFKQELLSKWQKNFNSLPDDMRGEDVTKAELHLRLNELCEKLWDIIDNRKEENEQERAAIMSGWLEGHTSLLINHHSNLMKIELNRFMETAFLLRVYYWGKSRGVLLDQIPRFEDFSRLETSGNEEQDKSQMDDGGDKPSYVQGFLKRSNSDPKMTSGSKSEPVTPPDKILISEYQEALEAIGRLMSEETQRAKKEGAQKKEEKVEKDSARPLKNKKTKNMSAVKQTGDSEQTETQNPPEKTLDQKIRGKIHKEYEAALTHEENAAKVRIELVNDHGLVKLKSLQSRAQENFGNMEKWFQDHYLSEMKCIDQLSEVVGHHIETGAKLQYQLVLEGRDFYINGDCQLVAGVTPPTCLPRLEKVRQSMETIDQLESLRQHLCSVAPSGFMTSFEFFDFLEDMVSINKGRNILPDSWTHANETQLAEIQSLLTDECALVDWKRFLLSLALPWPYPSVMKLLDGLQRFKEADPGDTGYINKDQYLQTELWFSCEKVQNVPDDPSAPRVYSLLAKLHEFFFQLFADHSLSPPRLDYVSMLQYFAAHPNPRDGFIRALSVELGQQIQQPSAGLIKSMPRIEGPTDLNFSDLNEDYMKEDALFASWDVLEDQEVSIYSLLNVICHRLNKIKDNMPLPPGCLSQEEHKQHLVNIYKELGFKPEDLVPFSILSELIETPTQYQLVNIHKVLLSPQDKGEQ